MIRSISTNQDHISTARNMSEDQTGKTTAIRRTAVRETGASRHHWGANKSSLGIPLTSQSTILLGDLRGALNYAPEVKFLQFGLQIAYKLITLYTPE